MQAGRRAGSSSDVSFLTRDVVRHGACKQPRLLADKAHATAQAREAKRLNIMPIELYLLRPILV
jgi:hypothetical protein